jgi:uncharacterized circularly permuted ATP-grasp superfamily protein/uncharacterized alpha-E superfamily protein
VSRRANQTAHAPDFAGSYQPLPGVHDELIDGAGAVRAPYQAFLAATQALGAAELQRRFDAADRHLRDSGVYYRVYDDAAGAERTWPLSHVPLILAQAEWQRLAEGVVERAIVLEAVLDDLYGRAELVSQGVLPAAVVAGSPEFLRPLVGAVPTGATRLNLYAVDLGRGPDGQWWVLGDRAQAPSGAGYALENRIALARALPDIYRSLRVERLAGFFQAFRGELAAHNRHEDARICLLTPGPMNEAYFEHAYLARYLGFLLVEGEDLTVRGDHLYVRTVSGLKRADVVWRRLDSDFADPLELNARSRLGVPGLVRVVRNGTVLLANALGSGLVETPGLMSFLPALGRRILGRELALANVATWWCGQPHERDYVLANLDELIVSPALSAAVPGVLPSGGVLGGGLSANERDRLVTAMLRRGSDFVGQEIVRLSTMPAWVNGALQPRPFIMRLFVARTGAGWTVMPGGFCRVSDGSDVRAVTMQGGGRSADVWVLSEKPVVETSLLPSPENVAVRRFTGALPSRAADNLFWLARYLERAEAILRILRALLARLGEAEGSRGPVARQLLHLLEAWGAGNPEAAREAPGLMVGRCLHLREPSGALPRLVGSARAAASAIRDRFSPDAWRALNDLVALVDHPELERSTEAELFERINLALQIIAAFSGLAQENMNRLNGWRFLEIGRRVERAIDTCRFVRQLAFADAPVEALDALLELGDSQITYRLRYVMVAAHAPVVDLLVLDTNNPRSVAFQVERVDNHLSRLPERRQDGHLSPAERASTMLLAELRSAEAGQIDQRQLLATERALMHISDEIGLRYFTHRERPDVAWEGQG